MHNHVYLFKHIFWLALFGCMVRRFELSWFVCQGSLLQGATCNGACMAADDHAAFHFGMDCLFNQNDSVALPASGGVAGEQIAVREVNSPARSDHITMSQGWSDLDGETPRECSSDTPTGQDACRTDANPILQPTGQDACGKDACVADAVLPPGAEKECGTNVPLLPAEVPSGHVLKKQSGFVGLGMPPPLPAAGSTLPGKKKGPPPQKKKTPKTSGCDSAATPADGSGTPVKNTVSDQTPNKRTKSFSSPLSKRWLRESAPKELDGKATAKAKAKSKAKAKPKTNKQSHAADDAEEVDQVYENKKDYCKERGRILRIADPKWKPREDEIVLTEKQKFFQAPLNKPCDCYSCDVTPDAAADVVSGASPWTRRRTRW